MDDHKKALLNKNRIKISENLKIKFCLNYLRSKDVLNLTDQQDVEAKTNDQDRAWLILDILDKRDNNAFFAFCHACKDDSPNLFDILHNDSDINDEECSFCSEEKEKSCLICKEVMSIINAMMNKEVSVKKQKDLPNACQTIIHRYKVCKVDLETANSNNSRDLDNYYETLENTKNGNKELEIKNYDLRLEILEWERKFKKLQNQNKDLQRKLEKLETTVKENEIKVDDTPKLAKEEVFVKNDELMRTNKELSSEIAILEVKNQSLWSKLREIEKENDQLLECGRQSNEELNNLRPIKTRYEKIKNILNYSKHRRLDRNITLLMINDRFGFSYDNKVAHIGESCVYLKSVDRRHLEDQTVDITIGDFIMSINDIDVTEFSKKDVDNLLKDFTKYQSQVVLRIRTPIPGLTTFPEYNFSNVYSISKRRSLGIELVTCLEIEPNSLAADMGILSGDQLININKETATEYVNKQLLTKISKCAQNGRGELVLKRISRDKTLSKYGELIQSSFEQCFTMSGSSIGEENSYYSTSTNL